MGEPLNKYEFVMSLWIIFLKKLAGSVIFWVDGQRRMIEGYPRKNRIRLKLV